MVDCLTGDRRAAGSSLTGVIALWSLSKTHLSKLRTGSTQEDPSLYNWRIVDRMLRTKSNQTKTLLPVVGLYSKTCLKQPLKKNIYTTKVVKTNGRYMQVESIAECSQGAFWNNFDLGAFCNTFDLHYTIIGLGNTHNFLSFDEWPLKTGFTVYNKVKWVSRKHCMLVKYLIMIWVWSGNTTVSLSRPSNGTVRKDKQLNKKPTSSLSSSSTLFQY